MRQSVFESLYKRYGNKFLSVSVVAMFVTISGNAMFMQKKRDYADKPATEITSLQNINTVLEVNSDQAPATSMVVQPQDNVALLPQDIALTPAVPAQVSKTSDIGFISRIQRDLALLGYYNGAPDGKIGPMTKQAVRNFQRDQKISQTGEIDALLAEELAFRVKLNEATKITGSVAPQAALEVEPVKLVIEPMKTRQPNPAQKLVSQVQNSLNKLGYVVGKADGHLGTKTHTAIAEFERAHNMPVTGKVSPGLLVALQMTN